MWERGAPRPGYSWVLIQRETGKLTRGCWYDRAGSGWSDLGPYPRTSAAQAGDLHALFEAANLSPPLIRARPGGGRYTRAPKFVGHSQDVTAQLFDRIGLARVLWTDRPAPTPPRGMSADEWNLIWR